MTILYVRDDRARALNQARLNSANLTRALAEHVFGTFRMVDRILLQLKQDHEKGPGDFDANMKLRDVPLIEGLLTHVFLVGSDGYLVASNLGRITPPIFLGDRGYAQAHASSDTNGMLISQPNLSRYTGRWVIPVTRRLNRSDGSYGGLIGVSLDPDLMSRFFRELDVGQHGGVLVVR